ncbi:hypothetical protein ScPMuIL_015226 [Solemya velum]
MVSCQRRVKFFNLGIISESSSERLEELSEKVFVLESIDTQTGPSKRQHAVHNFVFVRSSDFTNFLQ